ncbi:MAG: hypothetical protein KH111_17385 [Bacteroidales bacterium]|nr:hypothetical protein [Bacteroidales bacterium]
MVDGINTYIPCALACNYPGYKHGVRYGYKERNMNVAISPVDDEHVKVSVRGSLHKYFNGGKHNANDFTPGMARVAMRDLFGVLRLNPDVMRLGGFEFGVNIPLPFSPDRFINAIVAYNPGERVPIKTPDTKNKIGVVFEYGDYDVKIYNKSTESGEPYHDMNILRVEIKIKRRKIVKNVRLESVSDLLEPVAWKEFIKWLRPVVDRLLIYEHGTVDDSSFSPLKKQLFRDGTTLNYWNLCRMDHSRQTYRNRIRSFENLIGKYSTSSLKERVNSLLQAKLDEIEAMLENDVLNDEETSQTDCLPDHSRTVVTLPTRIRANLTGGEDVINIKVCPVTGLDISMQRKESRFLGITGIKFYMKHDLPVRDELFRRLSPRWEKAPLEVKIKEIAHSIRNEYYNPRNNAKRALMRLRGSGSVSEIGKRGYENPDLDCGILPNPNSDGGSP